MSDKKTKEVVKPKAVVQVPQSVHVQNSDDRIKAIITVIPKGKK